MIFTNLGTFPWPWEKKGKISVLNEYGLGLVFYFKILKSLAIIFTIMSAVTIPSMALFLSAKVKTSSQTYYDIVTHSERLLGSKVRTYICIFYNFFLFHEQIFFFRFEHLRIIFSFSFFFFFFFLF